MLTSGFHAHAYKYTNTDIPHTHTHTSGKEDLLRQMGKYVPSISLCFHLRGEKTFLPATVTPFPLIDPPGTSHQEEGNIGS